MTQKNKHSKNGRPAVSAAGFFTIKLCWKVSRKYSYSYWDSLIIASALESNCSILYTEDMQDGQIIEDRLRIMNPFSEKTGSKGRF